MKIRHATAVCFLAFFILTKGQFQPSSFAGILNLVRYQNTNCIGSNGLEGICLSTAECSNRRGSRIGNCANGFGACCLEKFTCGNTTTKNETVFVHRNYPLDGENDTDTCQVTIEKVKDVCQLRLDFLEFSLGQPDKNGQCTTDSFMVRTTIGEKLPVLCGDNIGQHLYVDLGRGSANPVVLSVVSNGNNVTRRWKIKISMIKCNSLDMAPPGCLQYHRKSNDLVRSFNWGPKINGKVRYLSNLRYTVCTRVEENFCAIKWETETPKSFAWGLPANRGGQGADCNEDDFIGISQGSSDGLVVGEDRFCGIKLIDNNVIITKARPFLLLVKSNSNTAMNNKYSENGFSLRYTQLPCVI
ncbi:uncharacterized protein LOC143225461 [Tachypleus tridentatus]|uniref:uncharacterized protein LOC143225461 n=1 Tax=Tachypleus tridentatus TaxID=6853 RepID=UPI003FD17C7C